MDGGACWATVHGVAKSRTRLSDFTSPCMKWSLAISNFLEEISSLFHSVVYLYFFTLITEEGFLISSCYSLELCIQMHISFFFSLAFTSLLFTAICKASPDSHFAFFTFLFHGHTCMQEVMLFNMNMTRNSEPRILIQESGRVRLLPGAMNGMFLFHSNPC